ncbi:MAG: IS701 family transposase [Oscillospiraceae bacterium]|nr:IS701 family transposase [Oscillospiraceae bacterium]
MEITNREVEEAYNKMMSRISGVFAGEQGFVNAQKYMKGLLSEAKRKNGWQIAENQGESTPYTLQQFIYRGVYSADELRDELRGYVSEELGEADGVLVTDDTGFIKQGEKSCGVQRQYTGTAGKTENCQLGVFLTYSSSKGHTPLDRRLYLPQKWTDDKVRRDEAGVPKEATFQTKPQMAYEMIREATAAGVPYMWVTGDCAYGDYDAMREWLENNGKCYVLCVSMKEYVKYDGTKVCVGGIVKGLSDDGWFEARCGDGSKGARIYDWQTLDLLNEVQHGKKHTMLFRRSKSDPTEIRAYICFAPVGTPAQKLVEIAGTRWTVETCFKESKGLVGLDQYEVRSYDSWYKHITFSLLALALITVLSAKSLDTKTLQQHNPASKTLDEFKRGRNLRV